MEAFQYYTPTKVIFGKDTHKQVGQVIRSYGFHKVLFHYGSGSIKRTGLYDQIVASLNEAGVQFVELGGVEANPKISLARKAAQLCIDEQVEMILAVGGGSVLDSSKSAAAGAANRCDPWLFSIGEKVPEKSLPVGAVLTISAAGSEMSNSCVMTNEDGWLKRGFNTDLNRPLFAIMNPELTYTVSPYQTACGITDIMMHTLERYFCFNTDNALTDRIAEGLLKSVIEAGKAAIENPRDYEARATLMWASSMSHNNLTGNGRDYFMRCHQIEHELSGMYDRGGGGGSPTGRGWRSSSRPGQSLSAKTRRPSPASASTQTGSGGLTWTMTTPSGPPCWALRRPRTTLRASGCRCGCGSWKWTTRSSRRWPRSAPSSASGCSATISPSANRRLWKSTGWGYNGGLPENLCRDAAIGADAEIPGKRGKIRSLGSSPF